MMPLDDDTLDLLAQHGYISQRQRTDPSSIPMKNGDLDWTDPQFKGLHPLTKNAAPDQAAASAATAAAPDLRYGSGATGQANPPPPPVAPPPPAAPAPAPQAGGRPVMFQPPSAQGQPGMVPLGGAVAGGPAKPPGYIGEMNKALEAEKAANVAEARANVEANERAGETSIGTQGYLRGEAEQAQAAEEKRSKAFGEQQDEYDSMRRDAARAGANIDYDRWMKSGGAGKRVAVVLAEALGAFGSSLTHTENAAQKIIEGEINRDVEQQKDQVASKNAAVREKAADLQRMRERFGDDRSAEAALRAQRWEAYKLGAQAEAQESQSPILQARADQVAAVADKNIAAFHAQIQQHQAGTGGDPRKEIKDLSEKIYLDSKGAVSPEDAERQAIKFVMQRDVRPGEANPAGWGAGAKGAAAQQAVAAVGAGAAPPSTNVLAHPINALTNRLGIAGSEGKEAGNKQADANAAFIKAAVAQGVMSSRSAMGIDPAKPPPALRGLIIGPNDTDKEIAEKRTRQREWLGAAGPGLPQQQLDLEESD